MIFFIKTGFKNEVLLFFKNKVKSLKITSMKKTLLIIACMLLLTTITPHAKAQGWDAGLDIYSSYIWRGSKFGSGPAFQPSVEFSTNNFTVGAWGSISASDNEAAEMDLYLSYDFNFGPSVGVTDYYYPGTKYFDFSKESGAHAYEINLGYEIVGLSLAGNVFLNEAGGAGTAGGDLYFEAGYGFKHVDIFVGGGDGWHTPNGNFNIVAIGLGTGKEIKITDSFSLALNGSVILNPTTEQFYIVVGISL